MIIVSVKKFDKNFSKLSKKIQEKFYQKMEIFKKDISHKSLNSHNLLGVYSECRSINITGSYRAIYTIVDSRKKVYMFIAIGTHSELYE